MRAVWIYSVKFYVKTGSDLRQLRPIPQGDLNGPLFSAYGDVTHVHTKSRGTVTSEDIIEFLDSEKEKKEAT